jgi:hypothetical protein
MCSVSCFPLTNIYKYFYFLYIIFLFISLFDRASDTITNTRPLRWIMLHTTDDIIDQRGRRQIKNDSVTLYVSFDKNNSYPLCFFPMKTDEKQQCFHLYFIWQGQFFFFQVFFFMTTNKIRPCYPLYFIWQRQQCYPLCFFPWRPIKNNSVTPYVFSWRPIKNNSVPPYVFFHDDQ